MYFLEIFIQKTYTAQGIGYKLLPSCMQSDPPTTGTKT